LGLLAQGDRSGRGAYLDISNVFFCPSAVSRAAVLQDAINKYEVSGRWCNSNYSFNTNTINFGNPYSLNPPYRLGKVIQGNYLLLADHYGYLGDDFPNRYLNHPDKYGLPDGVNVLMADGSVRWIKNRGHQIANAINAGGYDNDKNNWCSSSLWTYRGNTLP
ncbi:MAG: H-X9-DG-CTERM domain-containing protein, partial [Victivallales bacterium]